MTTINTLFIGNSFTARNNVPGLIAAMAEGRGHRFTHRLLSRGGASLAMHWNKGEALKAIQTKEYNFIVLQEQSTLPVKNGARFHENVRLFDGAIRAAGAQMVLYMTWARKHVPETQKALTDGYTAIGKELGAIVVPAGAAWQKFLAKHDAPGLHDKDGSHPTLAGSYLAACVFFAVLFKESPVGAAAPDGISAADAKLLQKAAEAVV